MAQERLVDWLARQVPQPVLYQEIDRLKAENTQLHKCIAEMRGKRPCQCESLIAAESECIAIRRQLERLREALRWYADESHYPDFDPAAGNYSGEVGVDPGARARQALGEGE